MATISFETINHFNKKESKRFSLLFKKNKKKSENFNPSFDATPTKEQINKFKMQLKEQY